VRGVRTFRIIPSGLLPPLECLDEPIDRRSPVTALAEAPPPTWAATAASTARRLAAVTAAGGLLGLLVGGVGGRLAMMLLARLNPDATGVTSDDGFTIGQFTHETLSLLLIATVLGVVGGGIYFVVRGLMIGPRWFEVLSISLGPAVVVGSQIVHTDGVDFTLDPALLAIALFVLIPGIYAALLTFLGERWLAGDGPFVSSPWWVATLPLLLWAPIAPLLVVLVAGLAAFEAVRRTAAGASLLAHAVWPWLARATLGAVFAVSLVDLVQDALVLA
jgi:hypothetical protein